LTYNFNSSLLGNSGIENASLSLIGTNLWLWAKEFNHGDPELLSFGGGRYVPGVENATVPTTRSVGLALNLNF
jgi:hypothetical protein